MRLGISVKIDVTKIEKARLFKGQKGTYLDLTTFIDTNEADEYGNHGFISQDVSKEERDAGTRGPILGNCKIFYTAGDEQAAAPVQQQAASFDDAEDIPF